MKIAIFYHCLFFLGEPPALLADGCEIINSQMLELTRAGLLDAAEVLEVGCNGGEETAPIAGMFLPPKAKVTYHGLKTRNENRTIMLLEEWVKTHPDFAVLYFHAKGASHPKLSAYQIQTVAPWREQMTEHCIRQWRRCVTDLERYESVGVRWMSGPGMPPGQSIWAGNFFWARSDFLATLPTIMLRDRIKESGIDALESRYEAEVWIGNGPRLPIVRDYLKNP